jgi:hypothetical protein
MMIRGWRWASPCKRSLAPSESSRVATNFLSRLQLREQSATCGSSLQLLFSYQWVARRSKLLKKDSSRGTEETSGCSSKVFLTLPLHTHTHNTNTSSMRSRGSIIIISQFSVSQFNRLSVRLQSKPNQDAQLSFQSHEKVLQE